MPFEYKMLVLMTIIFLLAWVPTSIAKIKAFGFKWMLSNRDPLVGRELPAWGARAERAYANLKDYFPGFIVAILLLGLTNGFDEYTTWASGLYVAGRILHYLFYSLGNSQMRFLTYVVAMVSNLFLLLKVVL